MSSMLEQAIVDARQLKETAQQSAEEAVVEKYQDEIREAVEKILEQDEDVVEEETVEMSVDEHGDLALIDELPAAQVTEVDEVVSIDLNKLEEMMEEEMAAGEMDALAMEGHEEVAQEIEALAEDAEIELNEADLQSMLEEDDDLLEVDVDEDALASLVTAAAEQLKEMVADEVLEEEDAYLDPDTSKEEEGTAAEEEAEKAGGQVGAIYKGSLQETKAKNKKLLASLKKQNSSFLKEQKKTSSKLTLLEQKLNKYQTVISKLKNKLEEGNLVNARLFYQNRVLDGISLNERQKDRIVEAISNAKTVEEAKIIYETLQSAVGSASKRSKKPESLNEVVTRSSSAFIPRKREVQKEDSFAKRMRILAGLK